MKTKSVNVNSNSYKIAITGVAPQKTEQAVKELSKTFNISSDIARDIIQHVPILFLSNLTKKEVRSIKSVLVSLSKTGIEFTVSKEPLNLLHTVSWSGSPKIVSKKIENAKPDKVNLQWQNIAIACPRCGETFIVQPIVEKAPIPKPEMKPEAVKDELSAGEEQPEVAFEEGQIEAPAEEGVVPEPMEDQIETPVEEAAEPIVAKGFAEETSETPDVELTLEESVSEEQTIEEPGQVEEDTGEISIDEESPVEPERVASEQEYATEPEELQPEEGTIEVGEQLESADEGLIELGSDTDVAEILPVSEEVESDVQYQERYETGEAQEFAEPEADEITEESTELSEGSDDMLDIDLGDSTEVVEGVQVDAPTQQKKPVSKAKKKEKSEEDTGERYKVFLSQITSAEKKEQTANLLAELIGCSLEEAQSKVNRIIIPVYNDATKKEAEDAVARFKELKVRATMTKKKA